MWSQDSERFMSWPRGEDRRASICDWALRYTNRHHPRFDFNQGMACYALAYLIDQAQGRTLNEYATGVVSWWGRIFR